MGLNKQVSVWRGNNTPPTDYHLWIKENGDILSQILGDWSTIAKISTLEDVSTLKLKIEDLGATKTDLENLKLNIEDLEIQEIEAGSSNILKSYSLVYNGKSKGTINIPKDRFLKSVLYDLTTKKLIFTFIIVDGSEITLEISMADLVDIYKAGDNVTIKNNTISVDFSPITEALNTKADKSDFDYVVKVNDDNKGNVINARLVVNNQTTEDSNNYDLVLGSKDESYIQIDSPRTVTSVGLNKEGNINIVPAGKGSVNIGSATNTTNLSAEDVNIIVSGSTKINASSNASIKVNNTFSVDAKGKVEITNGTPTEGFRIKAEGDNIYVKKKAEGANDVEHDTLHIKGNEVIKFLDDGSHIAKDNFRFLTDVLQGSQSQVRLRTSKNNSVRLTEGEGFKVFANLYAEPDHATDITNYTDNEKALLSNNTVQKILLDTTKTLNLKADSSTLNNYVLLNNVDSELSETSTNPILNKAVKAAVSNLNLLTSTLSQKLDTKADSSSLTNYLPLTGGTISNSLNVTGTLTTGGKSVLTSHLSIYKLTLQKNGSNVGTFTPTASDSTLNISVPTKLSELTDDVVNGKYLPLSGGTITNNLIVNGKITQGGNNVLDVSTTNISDLTIKINNVSRTIPVKLSELTNDIVEACTTDEINALFV